MHNLQPDKRGLALSLITFIYTHKRRFALPILLLPFVLESSVRHIAPSETELHTSGY